jgi:hypothetical protein
MITEDGRCELEIKRRIGIAKNAANNMRKILTSKQITTKLKMRIVNCYIYSILLYGAEAWTINKQMERKIDAFEMWVYRKIGCISWKQKVTNSEVLKKLGTKRELLNVLKVRQLKYFGHIKRHHTLLKTIYEGRVDGKRARGRPRYGWDNNIKTWTGKSLEECTIQARDRKSWRSTTANLCCGDGT